MCNKVIYNAIIREQVDNPWPSPLPQYPPGVLTATIQIQTGEYGKKDSSAMKFIKSIDSNFNNTTTCRNRQLPVNVPDCQKLAYALISK